MNPVANHLQIPVKLEWIDFTVWVGKNKQLPDKSQNLEKSLKIIWQNRMLYNFSEGMFATNDSPVHHSISNARENPFPSPAWGVASGSFGKRVFFGF